MAANELYEIFALRYAERRNRTRADNFKVTDDHDSPMPIDYFLYFMSRSPFPICFSKPDMVKSFERLEQLADSEDHIIPGHDPLVRALYAPPASELRDWVCRLDEAPSRSLKSMGFVR